ncbi:MAG TPA: SHOCT domain-containing protein, partial [Methanospirillum sp.]
MSDEDPIKILQIRFAKGEITAEQYEQMLSFLTRDVSSFKQSETEKKIENHDSSSSQAATSEEETIEPAIETTDKETDKDVDKEVDKESKTEEKNKEGIEEE